MYNCYMTLKSTPDILPRHSVRYAHASVSKFAYDATSKTHRCLNLTLAAPEMPDSSGLGKVPPLLSRLICHRWVPSGGAVCGPRFLLLQNQSGWWLTRRTDNRPLHTVRQDSVVWPWASAARGPEALRMANCCHKLVFHPVVALFILYVYVCVCGRCAITVSSFNPRISSNSDAGGKHWRWL